MTGPTLSGDRHRDLIVRFIETAPWPPSVDEIARFLSVSKSTVHWHLRKLEEQGRIVRGRGSRQVRVAA